MSVLVKKCDASHCPSGRCEETSSSLLRRVREAGDHTGWRDFVSQYEPLLLAYIRRRGLQEHDARDVVQEVFLRLHRALAHFELDRNRGRFRTWLWQVASCALADWCRTQQRRERVEQERRQTPRVEEPSRESDEDSLVSTRRRVLAQAVCQVQAKSLPKTWACFEQRVLRGRPSAAVAAELGLTPAAVNVNVSRTLARVRKECLSTTSRP